MLLCNFFIIIITYRYHFVFEMLNTFETFEVKEMRMFKHEPFFIIGGERGGGGGGGGGGAYLWYFTVLMNVNGTSVLTYQLLIEPLSRFTSNSNILECMLN